MPLQKVAEDMKAYSSKPFDPKHDVFRLPDDDTDKRFIAGVTQCGYEFILLTEELIRRLSNVS